MFIFWIFKDNIITILSLLNIILNIIVNCISFAKIQIISVANHRFYTFLPILFYELISKLLENNWDLSSKALP